jgi:hypothetical protein
LKVIPSLCLVAVGAALVVAGCGGGSSNDTLSYSDFGTQASQICKDGTDAVNQLDKSADLTTFANTIQPFVDKIKDLKAPDELSDAQDEFVSLSEEQIDAAKAGDIKKLQELQPQSDAAGSKMGAPECAKTGG